MVLWYTYIYRGFMAIPDGTDDMGRTTIQVSDELADELHERKGRGDSYEDVVWRLIPGSEDPSSERDPQGESIEEATPGSTSPHEESHAARGEAEAALRELGLPGNGSKYETRIEAVLSFYDYLREHAGERVSKEDLRDLADEADIDTGYSSFGSLWSNWVKKNKSQGRPQNTLTRLPGVEMDGDDYVYTGGR